MSVQIKQVTMTVKSFVHWLLRDNFKSSDLLTFDQVPEILREPHIFTGYRPLYRSWKYYVHSILHLHNETLNIWTHFIGFFITLFYLAHVLKGSDVTNDSTTWPVITFGICALISMLCSSIAHLLHSKSPWHHHFLFMLDYVGVAIHGFGIGLGSLYVCSSPVFHDVISIFHLPANLFISLTIFFMYCTARVKYADDSVKRKKLMIASTALQGVFLFTPVLPRYTSCLVSTDCSLTSLNHITLVVILDVVCAVTFVALVPERWFPGRCDVFGHSHQIFHIAAVLTIVAKLSAMRYDIDTLDVPREVIPHLSTQLWALGVLLFLDGLVYRYFLGLVKSVPSCKRGRIK